LPRDGPDRHAQSGVIGFTRIEDGDLAVRIEPRSDGVVLGAQALAEALAGANRLLALY
jgi:hypothetical protein